MESNQLKIDRALQDADDECENANYHSQVGLAGKIFESAKSLVPEADQIKLAKRIAKAVIAAI